MSGAGRRGRCGPSEMSQGLAQAVGVARRRRGLLDVGVRHAHQQAMAVALAASGHGAEGQDQGVIGGAGRAAGHWRASLAPWAWRLPPGRAVKASLALRSRSVRRSSHCGRHVTVRPGIQSRRVSSIAHAGRRRISMMPRAVGSSRRGAVAWAVAVWALSAPGPKAGSGLGQKGPVDHGTSGRMEGGRRGCRSVLRQHDNDLHPDHRVRRCREGLTPAWR